jgi:acetyl-CoA carboxylase alpha subunit
MGGAHRDHSHISDSLKKSLLDNLNNLREKDIDNLIASRNNRYLNYLP